VFTAAADLAMVLGPVVAAGVIATAGTAAAFAVDAVTYLIGAAATLPLSLHRVPAAGNEPSLGTWAQLHAGLRAVRTSTGTKRCSPSASVSGSHSARSWCWSPSSSATSSTSR
jgi:hypothetical protein